MRLAQWVVNVFLGTAVVVIADKIGVPTAIGIALFLVLNDVDRAIAQREHGR